MHLMPHDNQIGTPDLDEQIKAEAREDAYSDRAIQGTIGRQHVRRGVRAVVHRARATAEVGAER
jgi:hypothetical protein